MSDWHQNAVFVTGLMRSGTTLLLSLLDGHPELVVFPVEPSFDRFFRRHYVSSAHLALDVLYGTPNELHLNQALSTSRHYPQGFDPRRDTPIPSDLQVPPEEVQRLIELQVPRNLASESFRESIDSHSYFRLLVERIESRPAPEPKDAVLLVMDALLESLAQPIQPAAWVFKQPTAAFHRDRLPWFFDTFPQGKSLIIVRDPRGGYGSRKTYRARKGRGSGPALKEAAVLLGRIGEYYEQIYPQVAGYPDSSIKVLYYERLLAAPQDVMREVATFLGVSYHPCMTEPTLLGCPVTVGTARTGIATGIAPEVATAWQHELSPLEIALIESRLWCFFRRRDQPYIPISGPLLRALARCILVSINIARGGRSALRGVRRVAGRA